MGNAIPSQLETSTAPGGHDGPTLQQALGDANDGSVSGASVARWFLSVKHGTVRETVEALLKAAVHVYGGEAAFYSAPGGRGRSAKICGEPRAQGFVLVASSSLDGMVSSTSGPNAAVSDGRTAVMQAALNGEEAAFGRMAAAQVRTRGGLEGILLLDLTVEGGSPTRGMPSSILSSVSLWSVVLAERLDSMEAVTYNEALKLALDNVLTTLEETERVTTSSRSSPAENMIPQKLLKGSVSCDRVALWAYDSASKELVLNNNGQANGIRVAVDKSMLGESVKMGDGQVLCMRDVRSGAQGVQSEKAGVARSQSAVCVPLWIRNGAMRADLPNNGNGNGGGGAVVSTGSSSPSSAGRSVRSTRSGSVNGGSGSWSIVQFMKNKRDGQEQLDHFDLSRAEALQRSALPVLLQIRDCILRLNATERQREGLQALVARISSSDSVLDVAKLAQSEVVKVMDCEKCTLFFIDEQSDQLWAPPTTLLPNGLRLPAHEGVAGRVVQLAREAGGFEGYVLTVNDPPACEHWFGEVIPGFSTRNCMTTAIWSMGKSQRLLGVLQILNKRVSWQSGSAGSVDNNQDGFTKADEKLLSLLAQGLGGQLENLTMSMLFTKARMDTTGREGEEDLESKIKEYYGARGGMRSRTASVMREIDLVEMALTPGPPRAKRTSASIIANSLNGEGVNMTEEPSFFLISTPTVTDEAEPGETDGTRTWELDYWSVPVEGAYTLLVRSLRRVGVLPELDVDLDALFQYTSRVRSMYLKNPYHNFQHAIMVVHYSFKFMEAMQLEDNLTKSDMFALLIGALCHDMEHRGRNNAFESMTRSELAIRYNDRSVLENHHCAQAFQVALSNPECDVFKNLEAATFGMCRQRMISGILATDMKFHGEHVQLLQGFHLDEGTSQAQFLVELLLHSADISGPLMPVKTSFRWLKAVHEEFGMQVADEKRLGIPVSKFMDGLDNPIAGASSQLTFLKCVLHPLFDPLFTMFPGMEPPKNYLEENRVALTEVAEGRSDALD
mmetsp:Transcript_89125/g.195259  ORF Transcript_89125/g.195259 Transcript_89125/m.195259 type:complete len:1011 (-) Transcript_89125:284-3316(-)